jgi:hypothetical protein
MGSSAECGRIAWISDTSSRDGRDRGSRRDGSSRNGGRPDDGSRSDYSRSTSNALSARQEGRNVVDQQARKLTLPVALSATLHEAAVFPREFAIGVMQAGLDRCTPRRVPYRLAYRRWKPFAQLSTPAAQSRLSAVGGGGNCDPNIQGLSDANRGRQQFFTE